MAVSRIRNGRNVTSRAGAAIGAPFRHMLLAFTVAALALVTKLWLTSFIRVIPLYSPHDETNFLDHAGTILAGSWFGPYNSFTLIKGPGFPIYLASLSEFGLNLNTGHQLSYLLACTVACLAIKPIVRSGPLIYVAGVLLYFSPLTFDSTAWLANRSQIIGSLTLLTVACAAGLFLRRFDSVRHRIGWSIGLGCSLAAFWLTREDGIWIVPCLIGIGTASIASAWRRPPQRAQWALLLLPCTIWAGSILLVEAANFSSYGWAIVTETQSDEFIAAYASLERIVHAHVDPTIPIPREAREAAYRASRVARLIEPYLDGPKSRHASACSNAGCPEIQGGQFLWSLRMAVEDAGFSDSGAHARAFYRALAHDVDAACDRGDLHCTIKPRTLAPQIAPNSARIMKSLVAGLAVFFGLQDTRLARPAFPAPPTGIAERYADILRDVAPVDTPLHAYDEGLKFGLLSTILTTYRFVFPPALALLALGFVVALARSIATKTALPDAMVVAGSVLASGAFLLSLLAIIDALSFPAFVNEYLDSLYAITFFAIFMAATQTVSRIIDRFGPVASLGNLVRA